MNYLSNEIEIVLTKETAANLVRTVNALAAKYRNDYELTDIYLYNGTGKLTFKEKQKEAA